MGYTMAEVVSRRPRTAEFRVRSRFSTCGICDGQHCRGTDLFRLLRFSLISFISLVFERLKKYFPFHVCVRSVRLIFVWLLLS
jgi:hypothetical protein